MEKITKKDIEEKIIDIAKKILLGKGITDITITPGKSAHTKNNLVFYTTERPQGITLNVYEKKEGEVFHVVIIPNSVDIISLDIKLVSLEKGCRCAAENITDFFGSLIELN